MLGHHRPASETPFNGVSLAGRWWPAFSGIWILSSSKNKKKKQVVKVEPPLTNVSGSAHRFCYCDTSLMRSSAKIEYSQNGKITLPFSKLKHSCSSHAIQRRKYVFKHYTKQILAKYWKFTVILPGHTEKIV